MKIAKFFTVSIVLAAATCYSQNDSLGHFDCDYYNYFSDTSLPVITKEDSIQLERYSKKFHEIHNRNSYFKASPIYFYPFIKGKIDTVWAEKLAAEVKVFQYKSHNYGNIWPVVVNNAVIIGRVIDKGHPGKDTTRCLFFNTDYVIEVMDVIHSYFDLNKGDKVLLKGVTGYQGCGGSLVFSESPHFKDYKVGDESVFLLDRWDYQRMFVNNYLSYRYDDEYCPQFFRMSLAGYHVFDEIIKDKIDDLKLFFKHEFTK